jgi:hypothetical protein
VDTFGEWIIEEYLLNLLNNGSSLEK